MTRQQSTTRVTAADVSAACDRLAETPVVCETPIETSRAIGRETDATVRLKCEHLQRTGSFKTRGAYNKLAQLAGNGDERDGNDEHVEAVVAASAGNHAQGVALAAAEASFGATIVMPRTAPQAKVEATEGYGARVVLEGTNFAAAMEHAESLVGDGTVLVHAFDDPAIVAGQGTLAHELVGQVPDADTVVVPIGGGGLIGGMGAALADLAPSIRIVGVQAESAATVPQSLDAGEPKSREDVDTIADGIATGGLSETTFELIETHVDEIVTVTDEEIAHGILFLLERAKQLVEGAGASAVAAVLSDDLDVAGETVVPVLSGGNLDMSMLGTILTHELTTRSQLLRLRIRIDDGPGELHQLSGMIGDHGANIRTVQHYRSDTALDVGEAFVEFVVETSGAEHAASIMDTIEEHGYPVERVN